jgi:hypothetical protein
MVILRNRLSAEERKKGKQGKDSKIPGLVAHIWTPFYPAANKALTAHQASSNILEIEYLA